MNKQLSEKLAAYISQASASQRTLSSKLGVSSATLNLYLKGKYQGDIKLLEKKIKEFLERESSRNQVIKIARAETTILKHIQQSCKFAFDTQDIVLVIGGSGLGKTFALKDFAEKNEAVLFFDCDFSHSPKNILLDIAKKLKLNTEKRDFASLNSLVSKHLSEQDCLLIFDEAELLPYKSLETIRRLHDKSGVAVVLAGMPKLRANLRGAKGEFKQLYSRIGLMVEVGEKLTNEDLTKIILAQGIPESLVNFLVNHSKGSARRLSKILKGSFNLAKEGEDISEQLISNYSSLLME